MPDRTSSLSSAGHRNSAIVARSRPSKLISWLINSRLRASTSTPSLLGGHTPHKQIHSQLFSTFPLEIRRQIYKDVLHSFGSAQHIILSNSKLTHMRCTSPASHTYFQTRSVRNSVCKVHNTAHRKSIQIGWEIVPLLLRCKQT